MRKILVICGPTSTGKTALGIHLAKIFRGEIVSADSRQVYKEMDIITGKDIPAESQLRVMNQELAIDNDRFDVGYRIKDEVPIWLVDVVDPSYRFNVGEYKKLAEKVIENICSRGFLPIVVGGTGLYVEALARKLSLVVIPPNKKLRHELEGMPREQLGEYLQKNSPHKWASMNESDRDNPRRLIRAIEVQLYLTENELKDDQLEQKTTDDVLLIGLMAESKPSLYKRIDQRIIERIEEGAVEEARKIFEKGYSSDLPSLTATGYKPLLYVVQKSISVKKAINLWILEEREYARRQILYFKRDKRINWFNIDESNHRDKIVDLVKKWYTR